MRLLRQLLNILNDLIKAWPTLVMIVGGIISFILWIVQKGQAPIDITLPLSVIILIAVLALYPIASAAQYVISRTRKPLFTYEGLLWKPSLLFFRYPQPICPAEGCGLKVFARIISPPPFLISQGREEFERAINRTATYEYECATHGKIHSAPNVLLRELQMKAREVQRKH